MSLPDVDIIRERIQQVPDKDMRMCLTCLYLYAGRISEVIGEAYSTDDTIARGPRGTDATQDRYVIGENREEAVIFTVHTAKRNGLLRKIGIPTRYEPLATPLFEYFKEFGRDKIFKFTRQDAWRYQKEHKIFQNLTYPIEKYTIWRNGQLVKTVETHEKAYGLHAIRHTRATELVESYGFDGFNLAAYGGWTISTSQAMFGVQTPRVFSRYLYLNWQGYFPKLLKRRPTEEVREEFQKVIG